jgi:hypothetical protein
VSKQAWLDGAEVFDSWRVVPRLIVLIYLAMLIWLTSYFAFKFFDISAAERNTQLTAFASMLLTVAYGAFGWIYKIYGNTGRDWDAAVRPPVAVTQITSAT